jgi:hypothetical protein
MDLADRTYIESLLRCFYDRALHDELLAEPFTGVRAIGLDAHIPIRPLADHLAQHRRRDVSRTGGRAREGSGRQDRLGDAPQAGHAKASGSGPNLK